MATAVNQIFLTALPKSSVTHVLTTKPLNKIFCYCNLCTTGAPSTNIFCIKPWTPNSFAAAAAEGAVCSLHALRGAVGAMVAGLELMGSVRGRSQMALSCAQEAK